MIRVLLAEDQAMVRGALASLLTLEGDLEVVAQVARGDEVLPAARDAAPHAGGGFRLAVTVPLEAVS